MLGKSVLYAFLIEDNQIIIFIYVRYITICITLHIIQKIERLREAITTIHRKVTFQTDCYPHVSDDGYVGC